MCIRDSLDRLSRAEVVAIDTETTSLNYMEAKIVGISIAIESNEAYYIPVMHEYDGVPDQLDREFVLEKLKPWLEDKDSIKIGHHLKYDCHVFANHGIELDGENFDSMLESYVLNSTATRHNLNAVAKRYLSFDTTSYEDVAGKGAKQIGFNQVHLEEAIDYAAEEADVDTLSWQDLDFVFDNTTFRKVEIIQNFAKRKYNSQSKVIRMRFLTSPIEMFTNGDDKVSGLRLVKNEIYRTEQGSLKSRHTNVYEDLDTGLVFRSVGYLGSAVPGIPFDAKSGVICNSQGRILDPKTQEFLIGMYTSGWIKRGPTGVIGTNKEDSIETINCLIEDVKEGKMLSPSNKGSSKVEELVRSRQPDLFTFDDWKRIDNMEIANGDLVGRPRVKFTSTLSMLKVLGRR